MVQLQRNGVLPDDLSFQLKRRLNSHSELRAMAFMQGDPDTLAVASLVILHAKVALAHLGGNADKHVYGEVTSAVSNIGRPLFEKLAPAFAPDEYKKDRAARAAGPKFWSAPK